MRLIDADELREALRSNCTPELCYDYNTAWCDSCCPHNDFEDLIDNAPTVEERPQGEWIMHIDDLFPCESTQECSICHAEQIINGNDDNFCPNCGAKMKGGAE